MPDLLHPAVQCFQGPLGKTGPDSAREEKALLAVVANKQSTEVFAAAFGCREDS